MVAGSRTRWSFLYETIIKKVEKETSDALEVAA